METKVCKCCGKELPLNNFSKNAFGYTSVCKEGLLRKKDNN